MRIMNLTQHIPTYEQIKAGVENVDERHEEIKKLLTFEEIPDINEMGERAEKLVQIVKDEIVFDTALIGGAPYFMSILEKVLKKHGIKPVYSFSKRMVEEVLDEKTGKVIKKTIFKHIGFIEV